MKKIFIVFLILILTGCANTTNQTDFFEVGRSHLASKEYTKALDAFTQGQLIDPNKEEYYLAIADIHYKKGNTNDAIEQLKIGHNNTNSLNIAIAIADMYKSEGNLEEALRWYETTLIEDSNNLQAIRGKIKILSVNNQIDELKTYLNTLNVEILDSEILLMLAIFNIGDIDEANRMILKSNTVDDNNQEFAKELRLALTSYEQMESVHNLSQIVYILLNYGWYEMAQIPVSRIIEMNQFYETGFIYQGLINMDSKKYDVALENLNKVLTINPSNIDAKIYSAQVNYYLDKGPNAKSILDEIVNSESVKFSTPQYKTIQEILLDNSEYDLVNLLYTKYEDKGEILVDTLVAYLEHLVRQENYNQSVAIIEEIASSEYVLTDTEDAKVKALKAYSIYNLNSKQEGIDLITQAESIDNSIAMIHYYKGMILKDNGEIAKSTSAFNRAIELDFKGDITEMSKLEINQ